MNAMDAMSEDAIEIHPGTPNIYFEQPIAKGEETAPIMEKAAYVVEDSYYSQRQPHLTGNRTPALLISTAKAA